MQPCSGMLPKLKNTSVVVWDVPHPHLLLLLQYGQPEEGWKAFWIYTSLWIRSRELVRDTGLEAGKSLPPCFFPLIPEQATASNQPTGLLLNFVLPWPPPMYSIPSLSTHPSPQQRNGRHPRATPEKATTWLRSRFRGKKH